MVLFQWMVVGRWNLLCGIAEMCIVSLVETSEIVALQDDLDQYHLREFNTVAAAPSNNNNDSDNNDDDSDSNEIWIFPPVHDHPM